MKLDPRAECDRLFFYQGAALTGLRGGDREKETAAALWRLLPFIKALASVGLKHEEELIATWEKELRHGRMPFGFDPVGLPKEEP